MGGIWSESERAEEMAQREKEMMATGSIESFDSGVSLKSDQSKAEQIDFKDRVSPSGRETNQEVGWKHLEAPVSSCS